MLTILSLEYLLRRFSIPVDSFGKDKAKTLQDLLNEINNGDCQLTISKLGIHRTTFVVRAWVLYENLILKEIKQAFIDGRTRERNNLHLSEKMCCGEDKKDTLKRMFTEELGIKSKLNYETRGGGTKDGESPSYPSLDTRYVFSDAVVFLTEDQYKEDGYIEKEGSTGLTTYFKWVPLDEIMKNKLFL